MSKSSRGSPGTVWYWTKTVWTATSVSVLIWILINQRTQGAIYRTPRVKIGPSMGSNQVDRRLEIHGKKICGEYFVSSSFLRSFRVLKFYSTIPIYVKTAFLLQENVGSPLFCS